VSEEEGEHLGKGSAAELLGAWRAAERDRIAAEKTASVATTAENAASVAALDAARLSLGAAEKAEVAARRTAEAADLLSSGAQRERTEADAAVERSRSVEDAARKAFKDGQDRGFPKG
jgi:uncharacterized membrane protein